MSTAIERFFTAWGVSDDAIRDAQVRTSLGTSIFYADPRTEEALTNADDVVNYVGEFSKMAPGMPVSVADVSLILNFARATVRFGEGEQGQLGQYIADLDADGKITRLVGFVGIGAP